MTFDGEEDITVLFLREKAISFIWKKLSLSRRSDSGLSKGFDSFLFASANFIDML